jgi:cytochrome d ubiquinol oxidase subunit I
MWTYWTFRAMAGAGMAMLLVAAWAVFALVRQTFEVSPMLLRVLVPSLGLPYVGNSAGWIFTEIGRQPWIVFGLQKTADAVSPNVTPGEVLFSLLAFTLLYGGLMAADLYLLAKYAKAGLAGPATAPAAGAGTPAAVPAS